MQSPSIFDLRFGPQSQRNVASFLLSWPCFLPERQNWTSLPHRNTGPAMTLYQEVRPKSIKMTLQTSCFYFPWMNTSRLPLVYLHNSLRSFSSLVWDFSNFRLIGRGNQASHWAAIPRGLFLAPDFAKWTSFSLAFYSPWELLVVILLSECLLWD